MRLRYSGHGRGPFLAAGRAPGDEQSCGWSPGGEIKHRVAGLRIVIYALCPVPSCLLFLKKGHRGTSQAALALRYAVYVRVYCIQSKYSNQTNQRKVLVSGITCRFFSSNPEMRESCQTPCGYFHKHSSRPRTSASSSQILACSFISFSCALRLWCQQVRINLHGQRQLLAGREGTVHSWTNLPRPSSQASSQSNSSPYFVTSPPSTRPNSAVSNASTWHALHSLEAPEHVVVGNPSKGY